jgi:hypothetical protein
MAVHIESKIESKTLILHQKSSRRDMMKRKISRIQKCRNQSISTSYTMLGHAGEPKLQASAKNLGIKLTGALQVFECCELANTKKTKIYKLNHSKSGIPGCRIYIDISTIAATS